MLQLEVKNLSMQLKKSGKIIDKIIDQSFNIYSGDVILLTGPNGSGKSSIIKTLLNDTMDSPNLFSNGTFVYHDERNSYSIKNDRNAHFNFMKHVCYISQNDEMAFTEILECLKFAILNEDIENKDKYVFDFVIKYNIYDCYFINDDKIHINKKASKLLKLLKITDPSIEQIKTAVFLKRKKNNMSGGERKMLNIASNLIRYNFCKLCFIDEPLNNLDYSNVRLFSNMLTIIHEENPNLSFLIVTHCRSIPIINRIVQINSEAKSLIEIDNVNSALPSSCNSCFGSIINNRYV